MKRSADCQSPRDSTEHARSDAVTDPRPRATASLVGDAPRAGAAHEAGERLGGRRLRAALAAAAHEGERRAAATRQARGAEVLGEAREELGVREDEVLAADAVRLGGGATAAPRAARRR